MAILCGIKQRSFGNRHYKYDGIPGHETKQGILAVADKKYPTRNLRNVWTFPTQPYKGAHFATFPEELPRKCILAASRENDTVLDPFGGSGTTGQVAASLNRKAILCDVCYNEGDPYLELAKKRVNTPVRISKIKPVRKTDKPEIAEQTCIPAEVYTNV